MKKIKTFFSLLLVGSMLLSVTACKSTRSTTYYNISDERKYIEVKAGSTENSGSAYLKKVYITVMGECTGTVVYKVNGSKLEFNYSSGTWSLNSNQFSASSSKIVLCGRTYKS